MKPNWHKSRLGKVVLYFGSIRFAIPILALAASSLIYGTIIESSESAAQAGKIVYGSWWFITIMTAICITLILAVVTRYPWRKKHAGFIVVHASLITVIVSGFVTYFTGVEGEMALQEGMATGSLRMKTNELQVLTHNAGEFELVDAAIIDGPGLVSINGVKIEVLEQWANSSQKTVVLDDGPNKLHAVEISFADEPGESYWIGQLREDETPPMLHGIELRILPEGSTWSPPGAESQSQPMLRHAKTNESIQVAAPGEAVADDWVIESVTYFEHAIVEDEGLKEGESTRDNPAIQVVLTNENGSRERHIAFDRFRSSINKKQLEGEAFSEFVLEYAGQTLDRATIAITRDESSATATVAVPGAEIATHELNGQGPWSIQVADHECTILNDYANARGSAELVQAPQAEENTPALRVRIEGLPDQSGDAAEPITLVWGQRSVVQVGEEFVGIAYAPTTHSVPFNVELLDFRKMDYPGSEMAKAYESDVVFTDADGNIHEQTIFMNNPLEYEGWKIYQAGFVGNDVSIFQVAKDPGLKAMYLGCIGVCLGILVMYYSKSYSHGHPGMPKVFDAKKTTRSAINATAQHSSHDADHSDVHNASGGSGSERSKLESQVRSDSDPASRTHDADGYLRKKSRGRSHRSHKVG